MAWVSAITDRTATDLLNRTPKAFLNVSDWVRINGNTAEVQAMVSSLLGLTVSLTTLSEPTITHFPAASEINALVDNIERVRVGACLPIATGAISLKRDYRPGNGAVAPDYKAVNAWERDLDLLHTLLPYAAGYAVYCGVAAVGQPRFWQHQWR